MADLISRAAAIDAIVSTTSLPDVDSIKSIYNIGNGEEWVDGLYDAIIAVEEVNAVDAEPVRHGRWIVDVVFGNDIMSGERMVLCSVCGRGVFDGPKCYCPNCGAKMDKEADA